MQKQTFIFSIIIVNYHVKRELFACIKSIIASKPKSRYEIIVVDNDEEKNIKAELKIKFPKVDYIPNENKGFGQGNNVGARFAKGKYLFFLNPDTIVDKFCIDTLVSYLNNNKSVAIVAPLLYDQDNKLVALQGARTLTPLRAVFSFSFLKKLFPNNNISRKYWMLDEWRKGVLRKVETVPGTAFMIRKEVFRAMKGFDEKFFLYFEEHDLCKRVLDYGQKIVMHPNAKVVHELGASTKQSSKDMQKILSQSRFYYLRKHFGLNKALLAEAALRFNKYLALLLFILGLGAFLRFRLLNQIMTFIGDQGWFYLSARDLLVSGDIPLVGIASSHPWLHQGALWTYMLAGTFFLFGFNPANGAYMSSFLDLLAILVIYKVGSEMFSRKFGLIAAALYASSPLIVINARMPYHTSPIPLFSLLLIYSAYKWITGNRYYFPLIILFLGVLYSLELATILFAFMILIIMMYGFYKRKIWAMQLIDRKIVFLCFLAFIFSMFPILLYDIQHNFVQTFGFMAWIGYRLLLFFGYPPLQPQIHIPWGEIVLFAADQYRKIIFIYDSGIVFFLLIFSCYFLIKNFFAKKMGANVAFLSFLNLFLIAGFLAVKTPSGAYVPMLFPGIILFISFFIEKIMNNVKGTIIGILLLLMIVCLNSFYLASHQYSLDNGYESYAHRTRAVEYIVKEAEGKEYNLNGRGEGSQFESFTMNYEYLAWWLGHGPSDKEEKLQFFIAEDNKGITISKEEKQ